LGARIERSAEPQRLNLKFQGLDPEKKVVRFSTLLNLQIQVDQQVARFIQRL
jgi:transcription initiation factor TFIIIB Brf1 subunit/transcription initiation factor TFIIB